MLFMAEKSVKLFWRLLLLTILWKLSLLGIGSALVVFDAVVCGLFPLLVAAGVDSNWLLTVLVNVEVHHEVPEDSVRLQKPVPK